MARDRRSRRKVKGRSTPAQRSYYQRLKDSFIAWKEAHPEWVGPFTAFRRLMLKMKWAPPVHGAKRPIPRATAERQRRFLEEGLGRAPPSFKSIYPRLA